MRRTSSRGVCVCEKWLLSQPNASNSSERILNWPQFSLFSRLPFSLSVCRLSDTPEPDHWKEEGGSKNRWGKGEDILSVAMLCVCQWERVASGGMEGGGGNGGWLVFRPVFPIPFDTDNGRTSQSPEKIVPTFGYYSWVSIVILVWIFKYFFLPILNRTIHSQITLDMSFKHRKNVRPIWASRCQIWISCAINWPTPSSGSQINAMKIV